MRYELIILKAVQTSKNLLSVSLHILYSLTLPLFNIKNRPFCFCAAKQAH